MNARQAAFYRQSQSDWTVFCLLHPGQLGGPINPWQPWSRLTKTRPFALPVCHELHYLQMCTEKLAKAYYQIDLRTGHAAFRRFLNDLPSNPNAISPLGFATDADLSRWQGSVKPIVDAVEDLAPAIADKNGLANPEYPWPKANPTTAPADYSFNAVIYNYIDAQARSGEPPFLMILGKMIETMQSDGWHL